MAGWVWVVLSVGPDAGEAEILDVTTERKLAEATADSYMRARHGADAWELVVTDDARACYTTRLGDESLGIERHPLRGPGPIF